MTRIRQLLGRLREWWQGEPGRHALGYDPADTFTMPIVRLRFTEPDQSWVAEARLRGMSPHLYKAHDAYWGPRWIDFHAWAAAETAKQNAFRIECGLGPRPAPPLPASLAAA